MTPPLSVDEAAVAKNNGLVLTCCADITPEPIEWLWYPVLARRKITLVAGDPGLGKSFLTSDWVARYSTGAQPWPDGTPIEAAGRSLIISAEDGKADTIRPRLDAAGADVSRVFVFEGKRDAHGAVMPFTFHTVEWLREAIATTGATLVIIDPFGAFLDGEDGNDNGAMRALLGPLARLADDARVAVVIVAHMNKSAQRAIYRIQGSVGVAAAPRLTYGIVQGLGAERATRFVFPLKVNIAKDPPILGVTFSATAGADDVPCLVYTPRATTAHSIDEMLAGETTPPATRESAEARDAAEWLREFLTAPDTGAPLAVLRDTIIKAGHPEGFSPKMLRTAGERLGVVKRKLVYQGPSWWVPPGADWPPKDAPAS